jgi:hypothetical protein
MSGELEQREPSFDLQAAWLRHFQADAESNLRSFGLRLREALPDLVTLREERRGLFSRGGTITGVVVSLEPNQFILELVNGRLQASIAMVVRGIAISTRRVDPAEWFGKLADETRKTSDHARRLAQSLSAFMAA